MIGRKFFVFLFPTNLKEMVTEGDVGTEHRPVMHGAPWRMLARLCCVGSFRRPRMATYKLSRKRLMSEKVTDLPDEELRELPDADAQVGSIMWEKRKLEMEWRIADRQLEMSRDLVKFSK